MGFTLRLERLLLTYVTVLEFVCIDLAHGGLSVDLIENEKIPNVVVWLLY